MLATANSPTSIRACCCTCPAGRDASRSRSAVAGRPVDGAVRLRGFRHAAFIRTAPRSVFIVTESLGEAEHLRDELNGQRAGSAAIVTADGLDVIAMPAVVAAALKAFGRLDALINDASTNPLQKLFWSQDVAMMTESFIRTALRNGLNLPRVASRRRSSWVRLARYIPDEEAVCEESSLQAAAAASVRQRRSDSPVPAQQSRSAAALGRRSRRREPSAGSARPTVRGAGRG